jgi:hypothetical protein
MLVLLLQILHPGTARSRDSIARPPDRQILRRYGGNNGLVVNDDSLVSNRVHGIHVLVDEKSGDALCLDLTADDFCDLLHDVSAI